jgi:hypothetical protein
MNLIAEEVAEQEFVRMCDAYRIDHDVSKMDEKELASWGDTKRVVVQALCSGALSVGEDGRATYNPRDTPNARPLRFADATGATFIALDGGGDKHHERLCRACDQITGSAPGTTSKMRVADFRMCCNLVTLFLSAG